MPAPLTGIDSDEERKKKWDLQRGMKSRVQRMDGGVTYIPSRSTSVPFFTVHFRSTPCMHVCMVDALAVQSYHLSDSAVVGAHKKKKNAFHFLAHLSLGLFPLTYFPMQPSFKMQTHFR